MDHMKNGTSKPEIMWKPHGKECNLDKFRLTVNSKYSLNLGNYHQLWKWSTQNYDQFWETFWDDVGVVCSERWTNIVDRKLPIVDNPKWFTGARLNYAENILKFEGDRVAVYSAGEQRDAQTYTHDQLRTAVSRYAAALKSLGVVAKDRVVGYMPNCVEALLAMLATASIGAIWSSTSPDFGVMGVLDRFAQIEPTVIFSVNAVYYKDKTHNHLEKLKNVAAGLPTVQHVIVIPFVGSEAQINISEIPKSMHLSSFLNRGSHANQLVFEQFPFDHPLFIMYSSGTTGPPKCMGTLLQHMKEHILHGNMKEDDKILFYTTRSSTGVPQNVYWGSVRVPLSLAGVDHSKSMNSCQLATTGWMMWNWLVGALSSGGSVVLYDGSPFHPKKTALWDIVSDLKLTILGVSAKCLSMMEEFGLRPVESHNLDSLHTVLSTGSPLAPHQYDYVYTYVKHDVVLASISGGTDIISCFMGQNFSVPVYRGEVQANNLGMAMSCFNEDGEMVYDEPGELVCLSPFPCMPTHFWNDHNGELYNKAYFQKFPGVWAHGDYCIFNSTTNGVRMLGRSDATLNPNGVRFGTSELYGIIERAFCEEVEDCIAIAQRKLRQTIFEERVILFVKMNKAYSFSESLARKIKAEIRGLLSPRHVPALILEIEDIPYTISGKKVETAVAKIVAGEEILHQAAFRNPESLEHFKGITDLQGF